MLARFTGLLILLAILSVVVIALRFNRSEVMKQRCASQDMAYDGNNDCRDYTPSERTQATNNKKNAVSDQLRRFFKEYSGHYLIDVAPRISTHRKPQSEKKLLSLQSEAGKLIIELKGIEKGSPTFWMRLDYESLKMRAGELVLNQFEILSTQSRSKGFGNWQWRNGGASDAHSTFIAMSIDEDLTKLHLSGSNLSFLSGSETPNFSTTVALRTKLDKPPQQIDKPAPPKPTSERNEVQRELDPTKSNQLFKEGKFEAGILGLEIVRSQGSTPHHTERRTSYQQRASRKKDKRARFHDKLRSRMRKKTNLSESQQRRPTVLGTTKLTIVRQQNAFIFTVRGSQSAGFPTFKVTLKADGSQAKFRKQTSKGADVVPFSNSWFGIWDGLCWSFTEETKFCIGILEDDSFLIQLIEEEFSAVLNY